jgi:hypothetical protein
LPLVQPLYISYFGTPIRASHPPTNQQPKNQFKNRFQPTMKGMKGKAATVVPVATVAATAVAAKGAEEGHNFVRSASLLAALKSFFGYTTFRHSQERVINAVLDKRSALLVSATGATENPDEVLSLGCEPSLWALAIHPDVWDVHQVAASRCATSFHHSSTTASVWPWSSLRC